MSPTANKNKIERILTWLITLFPIFLIIGNFATNLFTILFSTFSIIYFFKEKIKFSFKFVEIIFLLFCITLIISTLLNGANLVKSVLFLRFFILFYFLNFFLTNINIDYEKIFKFYTVITVSVALDLIFQHFIGSNVIGLKIIDNKASSFFGEEMIAGSFIKAFGLFVAFIIFNKLNLNKKFKFVLTTICLSILSISILVTWQRVPMIIWSIFLLFYGALYFRRKLLSILISFFILIFFILTVVPNEAERRYGSFYDNVIDLVPRIFLVYEIHTDKKKNIEIRKDYSKRLEINKGTGHHNLFSNSVIIWQENKVFGIGIKNFLKKCNEKILFRCSIHPHNYYLDILVTTGLVGFSLMLLMLVTIFLQSLKMIKKENFNGEEESLNLSTLYLVNFLMFFFPFQSTGGFFTTSNSTFMVFTVSLLYSHYFKKK